MRWSGVLLFAAAVGIKGDITEAAAGAEAIASSTWWTPGGTTALATKVGYFGIKPTKVPRGQISTKPAKVGRLAATLLK